MEQNASTIQDDSRDMEQAGKQAAAGAGQKSSYKKADHLLAISRRIRRAKNSMTPRQPGGFVSAFLSRFSFGLILEPQNRQYFCLSSRIMCPQYGQNRGFFWDIMMSPPNLLFAKVYCKREDNVIAT